METFGIHGPFLVDVEHYQIRAVFCRNLAEVQHTFSVVVSGDGVCVFVKQRCDVGLDVTHKFCWRSRHEFNQAFVGDKAAIHKNLVAYAIRAFKTNDAVRSIEETKVLLFHGVWCMVGGQQIDGAVSYGCDGCLAILFGAQRRIHLGERAVFQQRFIAQRNVVRCSFARDR